MEPIVFRASRSKLVLLLVASLAFVAGGTLILLAGRGLLVGLMAIVFFGGCSLVFIGQLFDARPRLVIDDTGVLDRTLKVGVIAWDDILDAQPTLIGGQPFIALRLRNASKYTDRLGAVHRRLVELNQAVGYAALNVNLSAVVADPNALAALIAREAEVRRTPPKEPYRE